jgi:hypothetical protein
VAAGFALADVAKSAGIAAAAKTKGSRLIKGNKIIGEVTSRFIS